MELALNATIRAESGTGAAHKLRRQGLIPAVVYSKAGAESIQLSLRETERLLSHAGTGRLINLHVKRGKKDETTPVLIKEVQRNPIGGHIIHLDFHAVDLAKSIQTHVPIHLVGEERRLNDGAVIEQMLREVIVACLPTQIPEAFTLDISGLTMGSSLHVRDITPPEGVKIVTPGDEILVTAAAPAAVVEEAAPAETAEPEVVAEKGKEEE